MPGTLARLSLALKALRELGPARATWYAVYKVALRSGYLRLDTPPNENRSLKLPIFSPYRRPGKEELEAVLGSAAAGELLGEADEILRGQVRLFGGPPAPLLLAPPNAASHWTYYEGHPGTWGVEDIKFIWEPARFGWGYMLGRAYALTGNEKYPAVFWQNLETFLAANPPNCGPNWMSAQEVALRLLALIFAACAFEQSPASTPQRMALLAGAIAAHARRIPPTLSYARAQDNNHRIAEALGLLAAGRALAQHPEAARWRRLGWRELNAALQSQIEPDGTYTQHSMNYHRLMLQAVVQAPLFGKDYPPPIRHRLAAATTWLLAQIDPQTGEGPNLGANDGALILPLAAADFNDLRPAAQASARAFLGQAAFPPGPWDETGLWLNQTVIGGSPILVATEKPAALPSPAVHRLTSRESWATLRAVRFHQRPSHADQLHVDLWWRGDNVALDAGTFRYTAPAPWDNSLARTSVHNTVTVNDLDQMQRGGRFLWLDWAQARLLPANSASGALTAQHDGYRRLGIFHRRALQLSGRDHWLVTDQLVPWPESPLGDAREQSFQFRLHWLLPDWPWSLNETAITLSRPGGGKLNLRLTAAFPEGDLPSTTISLARAGIALAGDASVAPIDGWVSPTYNVKIPALSFAFLAQSPLPLTMISEWVLGDE